MTLAENVHRLTEAHMTIQDGRYAKVPALLDQLDSAARGEIRDGRGGGSRSTIPLSVEAHDLRASIEGEVLEYSLEREVWRGSVRTSLAAWPALPDDDRFLEHATLDWCDQITAMVSPRKPRRKIPLPCPSCGQKFHGEERAYVLSANFWDDDEAMMHPGQWDAACAGCGAAWFGDELKWLTAALNSDGKVKG